MRHSAESVHHKIRESAFAWFPNLVYQRSMDRDRIIKMLVNACDKAGSQAAWAKEHGMSAAYVSDVLSGRRDPGEKALKALGLERVVIYRKLRNQ